MKRLNYILVIFLLVFSLSFVSSNLVCGTVNDSREFSSSWSNVIIYKPENISNFIGCRVNPEKKFCCDLEDIQKAKFKIGDRVSAEVFDNDSGFVAGPVSIFLTGAGYDIFPELNLQKAIEINSPQERVLVNESSTIINLSLVNNYNSLKYSITSSNQSLQETVCTNCSNASFLVNLAKGKNEILLTAYGNREISEKIVIYNLDYLNFNLNVSCKKCTLKNNILSVPSEENITFNSYFNSSHSISGDFLFYFPVDWILFNSSDLQDFSLTHKILSINLSDNNEFMVNYTIQSPKAFVRKDYTFYQSIGNQGKFTNISVSKYKFMPIHSSKPFNPHYFNDVLSQRCSPSEPVVLNPTEGHLNLVAIFPKMEFLESHSQLQLETQKSGKNQEDIFTILTTISQKDVEKIFLVFKVDKGSSMQLSANNIDIPLQISQEDSNYTYYSAFVNEKGPFTAKFP